jgi:hypothetical protein
MVRLRGPMQQFPARSVGVFALISADARVHGIVKGSVIITQVAQCGRMTYDAALPVLRGFAPRPSDDSS